MYEFKDNPWLSKSEPEKKKKEYETPVMRIDDKTLLKIIAASPILANFYQTNSESYKHLYIDPIIEDHQLVGINVVMCK